MSRRAELLGLGTGLLLFVILAGIALVRDASVADEQPHILAGWLLWHTHRSAGGFDNPPLGQLLVAVLPALLRMPYRFPDDSVLVWCRLPVLLATAALGGLVWRWARSLGGAVAAVAALAMFALEPNLLAHGHVATLDALVTAAWWLALWRWRHVLHTPAGPVPWRPLAAFGAAAAAAMLVKFTAVLLLPVAWMTALAVERDGPAVRRAALGTALAVLAAVLAAHAVYGFGPVEMGLPQALVDAVRGKFTHRGEVQFAYLAGRRSEHGFLLYYVVALALKTPLPLLALAAWGLRPARSWSRLDQSLIILPAVTIVVAFSLLRVNIGVRHVLPAVPALILLAAAGAADLWRRARSGRAVLLVLAVLWAAAIARLTPQYFAFFNGLGGGPGGGHRWLLDSNLAWGQDDRRLQAFLAAAAERGETWDVGTDPELPHTGRFLVEVNALHNLQRRSDRPYEWLRDLPPSRHAGWSWCAYELDVASFATQAARFPASVVAQTAYAEVLRAAGDAARARAVLEAASARDPGGVAERVAGAALGRGDWRTAAAWLEPAARARRATPELQRLAEWCGLQSAFAAAPAGRDRARAGAQLGMWLGEHGKRRAALAVLRQAVNPAADAETWRALAIAEAQNGDYAAGRDVLGKAQLQSVYPAEFALCSQLASTAAAVAAGAAVAPEAGFELGRGWFESEQYGPAATAFAAVLRRDPSHRLALAYLGEMQVRCKMRLAAPALSPVEVLDRPAHR